MVGTGVGVDGADDLEADDGLAAGVVWTGVAFAFLKSLKNWFNTRVGWAAGAGVFFIFSVVTGLDTFWVVLEGTLFLRFLKSLSSEILIATWELLNC